MEMKEEQKSVITMASYALQRHLGWRTQAAWAKRKRKKERLNDGNNNGQLRIATLPRVAHAKPPGPINLRFRGLPKRDPPCLS